MVKANNVDLSLDDIISKTRKSNNSIQKNTFGGARRGGGRPTGIPRRSGGSSGGWKDLDDVSNHGITSRGNDSKIIRVNIANLAPTVVSSDLEELFGDYKLQTVAVNFNEHGESLGTGDVSLSKRDADRLIQKFTGVALDGKMMKFTVIDTTLAGRIDFGNRSRSGPSSSARGFQSGPRRFNKKPEDFLRDGVHEGDIKRGGSGRGGFRKGGRGGDRDSKPKKTEAELDAELEAYMAKRNS
uniref:FoP_duplication domain-containing protein n=1 Tax=Caenorhabditis tropicalis TaxID=1561998 RepID=A0A1I7T0L6_9PELO